MSTWSEMEPRRSARFVKLLGEAVAIGAGVLVALVADDWREDRSERDAARAGLEIVMMDLRADSAEFAAYRRHSARVAAASAWLLNVWDDPSPPQDTLEAILYEFSLGSPFQLHRAGFEGLRDTNRLSLIENDSIRAAVLRYYQERQMTLEDRKALFDPRRTALLYDVLPNHVIEPAGRDPGSMWPVAEDRVRLRHPWSVATQDPYLRSELVWVGRFMDNFTGFVARAEEASGALARDIADELRE